MAFRPTFWATICTIPALAILVALGTWQLDRLEWKRELIAARAERIGAPPVGFDELARARAEGRLAALEYRPIAVRGRYAHERAMRLQNRTMDGAAGIHLVVPLTLEGGGGTVLVDRGWVPRDAPARLVEEPGGVIGVSGYVRLFHEPGAFVPHNEPAANVWFSMDEPAMRRVAGAGAGAWEPTGFYIQAGPDSGAAGALPVGETPAVELRNSHLGYALTWYGLAVVLAAIYAIYHWRRDGRR